MTITEPPRIGDWMQTFTGKAFWPLDPRVEEIDPSDIAHALGMLCRYGGHVRQFYSVAEHCVLISEWAEGVAGPDVALRCLLHDATEAYMGDMVRPLKRHMPEYSWAEHHLMDVICVRFGLPLQEPPQVKEGDNRILVNERKALMAKPPRPWDEIENLSPLPVTMRLWSPAEATGAWSARLSDLLDVRP